MFALVEPQGKPTCPNPTNLNLKLLFLNLYINLLPYWRLQVKVAFGSVWKETLTELSGGQRSLLALSLILALLLFKPGTQKHLPPISVVSSFYCHPTIADQSTKNFSQYDDAFEHTCCIVFSSVLSDHSYIYMCVCTHVSVQVFFRADLCFWPLSPRLLRTSS